MPELDLIPGLSDADLEAFHRAGITTLDQLWARIDTLQGTNNDRCLQALAAATGIEQDRLIRYVSGGAIMQANLYTGRSEQRLYLQSTWLMVLAAALFSLAFALPQAKQSQQLVAKRAIEAYHPVTAEDVELKQGNTQPKGLDKTEAAVGRYSTAPIPIGTVLRDDLLSTFARDTKDQTPRTLISLAAKNLPSAAVSHLPLKVSLLFVPRQASDAPAATVGNLLLLSSDGTSALFAVPDDELPKIAAAASRGDAYVVAPVP